MPDFGTRWMDRARSRVAGSEPLTGFFLFILYRQKPMMVKRNGSIKGGSEIAAPGRSSRNVLNRQTFWW
jgi:hypothetical protein